VDARDGAPEGEGTPSGTDDPQGGEYYAETVRKPSQPHVTARTFRGCTAFRGGSRRHGRPTDLSADRGEGPQGLEIQTPSCRTPVTARGR